MWSRLVIAGLLLAGSLRAEEEALPTVRTFAGAFLGGDDHNYFVDSEVRVPLLRLQSVTLSYAYRESTPFLRSDDGPQAEVFARRQDGTVDFQVNDQLRLIARAGYRSTYQVDASGFLSGYEIGGGLGSPAQRNGARLSWLVVGGGFVDQRGTDAAWWSDAHVAWRVYDFTNENYLGSPFDASLSFIGDLQMVGNHHWVQPFFRAGPALQLLTAHGNRAQLQLQWYHNDNNKFLGRDENGFLFGLDVTSAVDPQTPWNVAMERPRGWLPVVWGVYDLGFAPTRRTSRLELDVEVLDFVIAEHLFTGCIWYESRQEYRVGDFDNIGYSVALGVQTPVGLESVLSHDEPLVAGLDFLHRSDHALNPSAKRAPSGDVLDHGSHNLFPRLRLQTIGWDLPYRNAHIYDRRTTWLLLFDWRVTAGWDINDTRDRGKLAGQLGLNWDVATVQGYVIYTHGEISFGNETPDWMGEIGVRRPLGRLFARFDSYGMHGNLARGDTFVVGVGVNL